jgi:glycerophosphoryl diester phosphodiesterase
LYRADAAWLRAVPIAHRGLHDIAPGVTDAPENSLPAFAAAIARGYAIELDVHLLADGHVLVFHDHELARMTGVEGSVDALDRARCSALRLPGGHALPLLEEVLELVDGRVPLLIEFKTRRGEVGPLERAVWRRLARYRGPYALQSFNPFTLAFFRVHAPHVARGQLAYDFSDEPTLAAPQKLMLQNLAYNVISRPTFIAYCIKCLPHRAPTRARARGLPLLAWTTRTRDELARARALADNVIFEGVLP